MGTIAFILSSVGLGILCSIPGLVAGYYWGKSGLVRNGPWWVLVATIIMVFGGRLIFPQIPLIYILVFLFVTSPFVYNNELWLAFTKGRWWWVEEGDDDRVSE